LIPDVADDSAHVVVFWCSIIAAELPVCRALLSFQSSATVVPSAAFACAVASVREDSAPDAPLALRCKACVRRVTKYHGKSGEFPRTSNAGQNRRRATNRHAHCSDHTRSEMSRREFAQVLDSSGALELILRARSWSPASWLTVLTYHRLHDDPLAQPFDHGVIDGTPEQFRKQIVLLKRYFTIIGLQDVLRFLDGRGSLPPNPAIVTFDDGYLECYQKALPILLEQRVKATFFISTSFVGERRVFWWDRIAYILFNTTASKIRLRYPLPTDLDLGRAKSRAHSQLLKLVKNHYNLDLERFLEELAQAASVEWNRDLERRLAKDLVMSWDQVRALKGAGMEIQSHTRTHRILQNLPMTELLGELAGSRIDLEEQLNCPISAISYPVGHSIACYPAIRFAVKEAGYRIGFSNASGMTWMRGRFDPFDFRRISAELDLSEAYFRALLAIPSFSEVH
jgi:peptidoglycan/xylan/chitin deacetylase (PgdA/CDA1 family)